MNERIDKINSSIESHQKSIYERQRHWSELDSQIRQANRHLKHKVDLSTYSIEVRKIWNNFKDYWGFKDLNDFEFKIK